MDCHSCLMTVSSILLVLIHSNKEISPVCQNMVKARCVENAHPGPRRCASDDINTGQQAVSKRGNHGMRDLPCSAECLTWGTMFRPTAVKAAPAAAFWMRQGA